MDKKHLDFLVIGAAKSGTTTLHELIKHHPEVSVPAAKEVPFFNDDELYAKGLQWYLRQHFNRAPADNTWGTVTPQYTYFRGGHSPKSTAQRIKGTMPEVKIIAILRHPIKRTFSHFKSAVRRTGEKRTFDEVIESLLKNPELPELRNQEWDPITLSLFASEYGRVLSPYYEFFDKDQILVLYMEDLKEYPDKTLKNFFQFIGVDSSFMPPDEGPRHNQGGTRPKISLLTPRYMRRIPSLRKIWRAFVPYKLRKIIEVNVNSWNAKADNATVLPDSRAYQMLLDYFEDEVNDLSRLTSANPPWKDWR